MSLWRSWLSSIGPKGMPERFSTRRGYEEWKVAGDLNARALDYHPRGLRFQFVNLSAEPI